MLGAAARGPRCPFGGLAVTTEPRESAPRVSTGMLGKLKWMVGLRLLLASALLGSAVALDLHERLPFPTRPLYGLLTVTFGLSLAYALTLRSQRWLSGQGLVQLTLGNLGIGEQELRIWEIRPTLYKFCEGGGSRRNIATAQIKLRQLKDGIVQNPSFVDYRIATASDLPKSIQSIIVEVPQADGPWGARGMGEMPYLPLVPAVVDALHDATGVWFDSFPLTPERVLRGLGKIV